MKTPQWALERIQEAKEKISTTLDLSREYDSMFDPLTEIPDEIFEISQLTALNLMYNQLTNLPESIIRLQNLTSLVLMHNQFTNLPESITRLQNLTKLDLAFNQFTSLPESITRLENLTTLALMYNQLTNLPESITRLQNLTALDLNSNQLMNLPEPITRLQNLTALYLHTNRLTTLPESIIGLQNLALLFLSQNQLTSLPESITKLQNLTSLYLDNNQLTSLPKSIGKLQKLATLSLSGNQLVTPPQDIAENGLDAIRAYFRQVKEQGQEKLYEAKLLVLGHGEAGKTTLVNKIQNSNYQLKPNEQSTEGVDIHKWSFPLSEDKSFQVNIWDFGGQEIYHTPNQFFLTKRSLYVLVVNARDGGTNFDYWLNVVALMSDNSPLLVVKNKKQGRNFEINERQLKGQFENLREVLATNLSDNDGLDEVVKEIQHQFEMLSKRSPSLPKTWVRIREALESDKRNYISLEEYLKLCSENDFTKREDSLQLSGYLHDIGVFLHFQDDTLLKRIIILKPRWGTDAVYKVLDAVTVKESFGRFTGADLDKIWVGLEYENMRDELLELMLNFNLCYELPDHKGTYIAPQLLPENKPDYAWDEKENLLLRYTYEFMPKGILSQFIVAMSEYIWNQTVWRSGVVLEKDKTRAEVIEDYMRRQVFVRIGGSRKKELMTIVVHELDQIHDTYKRLKYDKQIPCNCQECRTSAEPHFYKYEQLQNFIEKRLVEIQCGATGDMVNVQGLINDVIQKEDKYEEHESPLVQNIYYGDHIDQGEKKMTKIN